MTTQPTLPEKLSSLLLSLEEREGVDFLEKEFDSFSNLIVRKLIRSIRDELNLLAKDAFGRLRESYPSLGEFSFFFTFMDNEKGDFIAKSFVSGETILFEKTLLDDPSFHVLEGLAHMKESAVRLIETDEASLSAMLDGLIQMKDDLLESSPRLQVYATSDLLLLPRPRNLDLDLVRIDLLNIGSSLFNEYPRVRVLALPVSVNRKRLSIIDTLRSQRSFTLGELSQPEGRQKMEDHLVSVCEWFAELPLAPVPDGVQILRRHALPFVLTEDKGHLVFRLGLNATQKHLEVATRLVPVLHHFGTVDNRFARILRGLSWTERPSFNIPVSMPYHLQSRQVFTDISPDQFEQMLRDIVAGRDAVLAFESSDSLGKVPPVSVGFQSEYFGTIVKSFSKDGDFYHVYRVKGARRKTYLRYFRNGKSISNRSFHNSMRKGE